MRKFLVSFLFLSLPIYAINYVQSPPLTNVVSTTSKDCTNAENVQVPLITWGGDIATVLANNGKKTTQDSIFGKKGLKLTLKREDVFFKQVENYLSCKSPFLRGTMGMINMAQEITDANPQTKMQIIYQLTWSVGGDAIIVKSNVKTPKDLKGKTIAVQAYGPHVAYLAKILDDAGLKMSDVKIKWLKDLTASENSPREAFYESDIDAAMVIIPDALALTSNGTVGTGSEDSVKGAKILLSTKSMSQKIADVYAVRTDFLEANRSLVAKFVHGLMLAEEKLKVLSKSKNSEYGKMIKTAANILLDNPLAVEDTEGMYADAQFVGWKGNIKFLGTPTNPRNLDSLTAETQTAFIALGLRSKKLSLSHAKWDYNIFKKGLKNVSGVEAPKFDTAKVAQVVSKMIQQGTLEEDELFSFEVYFKPNQNSFPATAYAKAFDKVISLATTYGGALILVEGNSDPLGFLKAKKAGLTNIELSRKKQAAKNLSLTRANAVRDSVILYAKRKGVTLDSSQFAIIGHGIMSPANGLCGQDPCAPKTKQEWLNNMRVEFRIKQVEAEASVFTPL